MMNRKLYLSLALMGCLNLTGCSISTILPDPEPASKVYRLTSEALQTPSANAYTGNGYSVRIDRPNAAKALQGVDLLVVQEGNRLVSVARAEWSDNLPTLIQRSFVSHLEARPDFTGLLPTSGARPDYRAHITIRNFEAEFDQGEGTAPRVTIDYLVTLSHAGSRNLIDTEVFRLESRSSSNGVPDIVNRMSASNAQIIQQISDWMAVNLARIAG